MAGKTQRHAAIMEIIGGVDVASQEQLRSLLAERGMKVTQAELISSFLFLAGLGLWIWLTRRKKAPGTVSARPPRPDGTKKA